MIQKSILILEKEKKNEKVGIKIQKRIRKDKRSRFKASSSVFRKLSSFSSKIFSIPKSLSSSTKNIFLDSKNQTLKVINNGEGEENRVV